MMNPGKIFEKPKQQYAHKPELKLKNLNNLKQLQITQKPTRKFDHVYKCKYKYLVKV